MNTNGSTFALVVVIVMSGTTILFVVNSKAQRTTNLFADSDASVSIDMNFVERFRAAEGLEMLEIFNEEDE